MAKTPKKNASKEKRVTRYTYDEVKEPGTPETGYTASLPADEQIVNVAMDNGWSEAMMVGKLPKGHDRSDVLAVPGIGESAGKDRFSRHDGSWNSDYLD